MYIAFAPNTAKSWSTFACNPVKQAITEETDATPITIPMVVSIERVFFAHICPSAR
jgi:hypothetical protein